MYMHRIYVQKVNSQSEVLSYKTHSAGILYDNLIYFIHLLYIVNDIILMLTILKYIYTFLLVHKHI